MKRLAHLVGLLVAASSFAQAPLRDAFLEHGQRRDLVEPEYLSEAARRVWNAGVVTATEPRYGVPTVLWLGKPDATTTTPRAQGLSAERAARKTLRTVAELYRGDPSRWADARLAHLHDLHDGGPVIATFQQDIGGVRVFRDEVKVAMTPDYVAVAVMGYLTPETKTRGTWALGSASAAVTALNALTGTGHETNQLHLIGVDESGAQLWQFAKDATPVRARRVWFPLPEGLEPAFYVEAEVSEGTTTSAYHSFVISGRSGEVLFEKNLTSAFDYRVWADTSGEGFPLDGPQGNTATPHPTGTASGFQPAFVAPSLVSVTAGPISTRDVWLSPTATRTEGNNAFAYADIASPNGFGTGDLAPTPTAEGVFDRAYDVTQNPDSSTEQRLAATTQLFYDVNFFHDWYYDKGFTEADGNAQTSNFGRGGYGNDALNAEAQDYSGRDNANMSTPSDGAKPRMQMYIFNGQKTERLTIGTSNLPALSARFGPSVFNVSAEVALVDDGDPSGTNGSTSDACQLNFQSPVAGKIALVDRGNCTFTTKVANAQSNGAVGVIIVDINASNTPPDLVGNPSPNTSIPTMSTTRAAGASLRMTLGQGPVMASLVRSGTVDRDGTIDNAVIAHEWGHYISNRLIGDGNGLSAQQSTGMGEGWADFHALLMMVKEEDAQVATNANWAGVYAIGGYTSSATSSNGYYFGVRRLPYSVDFAKNGLTFKHIQQNVALPAGVPTAYGRTGSGNAELHATGEVWATMLWECYVALLRDSQRLTFTEARERMARTLVAAYKLTPMMPTFVEARDAVLAAAIARDPQDFALFWAAFARRGLGMTAQAPDRDAPDNRPAVESFVVGNALAITGITINDAVHSCDNDGVLDTDEQGFVSVTVKNVGAGALMASTVTLSTTAPGLTFPDGATMAVPALQPFASATVKLPITLAGVRGFQGVTLSAAVNDPSLAIPGPVTKELRTRLNADLRPASSSFDDVEAPMSLWLVANDPNGNTGSDWRIAQNSATEHWWFGPNPASPADTYLISPTLQVGAGPLTLTFKHRFDFEADATSFYDGATLELTTDGRNWTDLGASAMPGYTGSIPTQSSNPLRGRRAYVGTSPNYPTFNTETVSLGTTYAGRSIRLRFRIGSDDAAAKKGWEVDDVRFTGLANGPFTSVAPDPNTCSGNRAPQLVSAPDVRVTEGQIAQLTATATDADGDAVTLRFTQKEGPLVDVMGASFTAPMVERDTTLVFEVAATDGALDSTPLRLTVTVLDGSTKPRVSAPAHLDVGEGDAVELVATGFDPHGATVTYRWTQVLGAALETSTPTEATLHFVAPFVDEDTLFTFEVVSLAGSTESDPARVEVLVQNRGPTLATPKLGKAAGCQGCSSGSELGALVALLLARGVTNRRRREAKQ